jgi:hypothetical protein
MRGFPENGGASSRSKAFFSFASKASHSKQTVAPHDINFLQLPPKELREEEYILSALMANSR